jgi:hypothetical protein
MFIHFLRHRRAASATLEMMYKGLRGYLADPMNNEGMLSISGTKFTEIIQSMKESDLKSQDDIQELCAMLDGQLAAE